MAAWGQVAQPLLLATAFPGDAAGDRGRSRQLLGAGFHGDCGGGGEREALAEGRCL